MYVSTGETVYVSTGETVYVSTGETVYVSTGETVYVSTGEMVYVSTGETVKRSQYLWWLEGVIRREGDVQEEHATFIHRARGSQDGGSPFVDVVSFGSRTGERS